MHEILSLRKFGPTQSIIGSSQADSEFETLLPLGDKDVKASAKIRTESCEFLSCLSRGVETNRDEWVYDDSTENLTNKVKFLIDVYEAISS